MMYANSDDFFIKLIFVTIYANKIIYKIRYVTVYGVVTVSSQKIITNAKNPYHNRSQIKIKI
jgi:hypothetical protein